MKELSEILRKLRGKRSLREVSEISGVSHSYIKVLEDNYLPRDRTEPEPTPSTLRKLSKAYNVPYGDLMRAAGYLDGIETITGKRGTEDYVVLNQLTIQNIALKNCLKSLLDSY